MIFNSKRWPDLFVKGFFLNPPNTKRQVVVNFGGGLQWWQDVNCIRNVWLILWSRLCGENKIYFFFFFWCAGERSPLTGIGCVREVHYFLIMETVKGVILLIPWSLHKEKILRLCLLRTVIGKITVITSLSGAYAMEVLFATPVNRTNLRYEREMFLVSSAHGALRSAMCQKANIMLARVKVKNTASGWQRVNIALKPRFSPIDHRPYCWLQTEVESWLANGVWDDLLTVNSSSLILEGQRRLQSPSWGEDEALKHYTQCWYVPNF